jgi:hypothetical protein
MPMSNRIFWDTVPMCRLSVRSAQKIRIKNAPHYAFMYIYYEMRFIALTTSFSERKKKFHADTR